jgi:hypothetical protein
MLTIAALIPIGDLVDVYVRVRTKNIPAYDSRRYRCIHVRAGVPASARVISPGQRIGWQSSIASL